MYSVNSSDPFTELLAAHDAATNQHCSTATAVECVDTELDDAIMYRDYSVLISSTPGMPAAGAGTSGRCGLGRSGGMAPFAIYTVRLGVENSCTGSSSTSFSFNGGA